MTLRYNYDEPNGTIIGSYIAKWQLFYDGRPQSQQCIEEEPISDDAVLVIAQRKIDSLVAEYGGYPCYLYPDKSKWEVCIWH